MERPRALHVEKPWGFFDRYALNETCTVKIITCRAGERLSLQRHGHRDELWVALDEGAVVELDGVTILPRAGDEVWIPRGGAHRLGCQAGQPPGRGARVLEISFGDFDEADIERLEDSYGRA